ncbi:T9SS type A sorting domain-containing protein [Dyadobacter sp. CY312]|uniref:T9SS type A sorting domain-containing protein n=1 Tax=Dyadobacter sp. CY312 TaxID=2907303 RepID=UPI001F42D464|nr:alpha-amylase family glycosyl hydrolase [Dyadobacter sp. CY312]MCE7042250.1 T9SS type A sorting domain-containing protein [Dyadobacter sp. CY312]
MKQLIYVALLVYVSIPALAQQVMMQGFYYDIPKAQCGAAWADTMALKASQLKASGFTHIWTPPFQGNGANSGGYDPRNLYIGDNTTVTSLGTKQQILDMVSAYNATGMQVVGDMIYNHRDGGAPEINDPVLDYVMNKAGGNNPGGSYQYSMPSDRFHYVLPLGGTVGNGEGKYYAKFSSRNDTYDGAKYMLYVTTNKIGGSRWSPVLSPETVLTEMSGNYAVELGRNYEVRIDGNGDVDEFEITVNPADFNAGDELIIYAININPSDIASYSNHRPYEIWYDPQGSSGNGSARHVATAGSMWATGGGLSTDYKLRVKTYTDFSNLPGTPTGQDMHGGNFRPNWGGDPAADVNQTTLGPAWSMQSMDYFYDYDHRNPDTKQKLIDWTLWSWDQVGIRGLRMDAIKHFPASFVGDLLCAMHAAGKDPSMIVGEWYGEDPGPQGTWLNDVYAKLNACGGGTLNPKVFDFNLRSALKKASDGGNGVSLSTSCGDGTSWDVRGVFDQSLHDLAGFSGNNVVTMANNHDFRESNVTYGNSLIHSRADALNSYAYMFTNNHLGVPTVFWPDYYGYNATTKTWNGTTCVDQSLSYFPVWADGGLSSEIDGLIGVLKNYIHGSSEINYLNKFGGPAMTYHSGCYQRSLIYQNSATGSIGGKEIVNVINYGDEAIDVEIPIIQRNNMMNGEIFTKIAGTSSTVQPVWSGGVLRVSVPAHSFAIWAQGDFSPLPVTLTNFDVKALPNSIELNWKSTSESNFSGYEVQRSFDGKEFINLKWIPAKLGKESSSTYIYSDSEAAVGQTLYYRLKMTDTDGSSAYSNIKSAKIDPNELLIQLMPNPVHISANVLVNNPRTQSLELNILNVGGQVVHKRHYNLPKGISTIKADVSQLSSGTYLITVTDGKNRQVQRMIVQ